VASTSALLFVFPETFSVEPQKTLIRLDVFVPGRFSVAPSSTAAPALSALFPVMLTVPPCMFGRAENVLFPPSVRLEMVMIFDALIALSIRADAEPNADRFPVTVSGSPLSVRFPSSKVIPATVLLPTTVMVDVPVPLVPAEKVGESPCTQACGAVVIPPKLLLKNVLVEFHVPETSPLGLLVAPVAVPLMSQ
jgi:hypothetical protein